MFQFHYKQIKHLSINKNLTVQGDLITVTLINAIFKLLFFKMISPTNIDQNLIQNIYSAFSVSSLNLSIYVQNKTSFINQKLFWNSTHVSGINTFICTVNIRSYLLKTLESF